MLLLSRTSIHVFICSSSLQTSAYFRMTAYTSAMLFVFVISFALLTSSAHGWGATGHALVAQIAQSILTRESTKFVRDHLPWYATGNLSMLASWPDSIQYANSNPVEYLNWQWSKVLHYVNVPDWNPAYNRDRDCEWSQGQRCVDGAVQNYTERLADAKLDSIQRQEALRFLVHFIGDVHQPLHAGFVSDKGGNAVIGRQRSMGRCLSSR